jgi:Ca2+-binding RTX toxin-like protein
MTADHRRRLIRTLAAGLLVAVCPAAVASQVPRQAARAFSGSEVFATQDGVEIVAGDADNAIEAELQFPGSILIKDPAGVSAANDPFPLDGFGCVALDSTRARCDFPSDGGLTVSLGPGDDVVNLDRAIPGQIFGTAGSGRDSVVLPSGSELHLRLRGNKGADVLVGASASDQLRGGRGEDRLRGRAGPDRLNGDKGRDRLLGGPGGDLLHARDGDRDRRIDCGRGADRAAIDRRLDPPPVSCEDVPQL